MSHSDREREIPVPSALARACADSPCSASRRWLPSIAQAISELRPPTGGLPPTAAASARRRRPPPPPDPSAVPTIRAKSSEAHTGDLVPESRRVWRIKLERH